MHLLKMKYLIFTTLLLTLFFNQSYSIDFSSIDHLAIQEGFNGIIALRYKDNIVFANSYGFLDHERKIPCEKNSLFRVASITKQFTAAAILILEEKGLLNVNDPISKYLSNYPIKIAEQVTIHHLLTHTSGIQDYAKMLTPQYLETCPKKFSVGDLVSLFKDKPLLFEPGEKYSYSNSGYILLGMIIEKISNQPYGEFIQKSIFDRLGMKNIKYRIESKRDSNEAVGYSIDSDGQLIKIPDIQPSLTYSSDGLISNFYDLFLWQESLDKATLLTKKSIDKMQTAYVPRDSTGLSYYGYGAEIEFYGDDLSKRKIGHGGSLKGFRCMMIKYVDEDLSLVILSNHDHQKALLRSIEKALIQCVLN